MIPTEFDLLENTRKNSADHYLPANNNNGRSISKNMKKRFLFLLSALDDCNSHVSKHNTEDINK